MLIRQVEASDVLTESDWRRIAGSIEWLRRYPLLLGIGYADAEGDHAPVRFVESRVAGSEAPDGADLAEETEWRAALAKARTTGEPAAASGPDLSPFIENTSIVIFGPVLKGPPRSAGESHETKSLRGFVFVSFNPNGLLRDKPHAVSNGMLEMAQVTAPSGNALHSMESFSEIVSTTALGHTWTIRYTPGRAFVRDSQAPLPWWVLGGGIAVSVLLFGIVWTQIRLRLRDQALNAELEQRISERTAELQMANTRLEEAFTREHELSALKSNFISMVSHELRNPLGIILSSAQILERYGDRIPAEKSKAQLAAIHHAVFRITALTEEVLLFGKFEAGRVQLQPAPVDLDDLCEVIADETRSMTNGRCPIEVRTAGDFGEAQVDEKLLRHILGNLLQNAVKFSPTGLAVTLALRRENDEAVFEVSDRGIGIPPADRARLFHSFHRCSNVGHLPGTGLGLVIVKRCVDAHRGRIEITSNEGKGTIVAVRLPIGAQQSEKESPESSTPRAATLPNRSAGSGIGEFLPLHHPTP